MKELVAPFATLIFMASTFGLMIHSAFFILSTGTLAGLAGWIPFIAVSALAMAVTDTPSPLWDQ